MEPLFETAIQRVLRTTLIDNAYLYIDLWSFVHLFTGLLLGYLFARFYPKKYSWLIVLLLLVLYEVVEPILDDIIFLSESSADAIWDVIIGQAGFFLSYFILRRKFFSNK